MAPNREDRRAQLLNKLYRLQSECNCLVEHKENILNAGLSIIVKQDTQIDQVQYLKSFPESSSLLDKLINFIVGLNCSFEILVGEVNQFIQTQCDTSRKCSSETTQHLSKLNSVSKEIVYPVGLTFEEFSSCISGGANSSFCSLFSTAESENGLENGNLQSSRASQSSGLQNDLETDLMVGIPESHTSSSHDSPLPDTTNSALNVKDVRSFIVSDSAIESCTPNITNNENRTHPDDDVTYKVPNKYSSALVAVEIQSEGISTEAALGMSSELQTGVSLVEPYPTPIVEQQPKKQIKRSYIGPGTICEMNFACGLSPWDFWLYPLSTKDIDALNKQMFVKHQNGNLLSANSALTIGNYFSAFDGSKCFRGQLLSVNASGGSEGTFLDVDTGKILKIGFNNVRDLDEEFLEFPSQAINCQWIVKPEEFDNKCRELITELFFRALRNRILIVSFVGVHHDPPHYVVSLDVVDRHSDVLVDMSEWFLLIKPKLEQFHNLSGPNCELESVLNELDPFTIYGATLEPASFTKGEPCPEEPFSSLVICEKEETENRITTEQSQELQQAHIVNVPNQSPINAKDVP